MHRLLLVVTLAGWACSSSGSQGNKKGSPAIVDPPAATAQAPAKPDVTIFFTTEMKGSIEPCGCTSDPLGDLARTAKLIEDRRTEGPVLVMDGGSTLYTRNDLTPKGLPQEQLKSGLIFDALTNTLKISAAGLGPFDLAEGAKKVRPARHAVNVPAKSGIPLAPPQVLDVKGKRIGVFGVVSPNALGPGIQVSDPKAAATATIAQLKKDGADVVIALAHMPWEAAKELAQTVKELDFVLVGQNAPEPDQLRKSAVRVGDTWLFQPANRGQVVSRLELTIKDDGPFTDAIGEMRAKEEGERLAASIQSVEADLKSWKNDPTADPSFVATKEHELAQMKKRANALTVSPLQAPETGSYFTFAQISISKSLPCDTSIVLAKKAYDKSAGEQNVAAAKGTKPPKPPKGKAGYVGIEECDFCHSEAVAFFQKSRHAQAWKTLTDAGKEFDLDCIGCHVTGFDEPGGSNLAVNEHLRNVQCESCHGPGSIHVDEDGKDKPATLVRQPKEERCVVCHSPEHSDTFDYTAYLRDMTGPGHGAAFRAQLGDGVTGRELRSAALKKAGQAIGAGCPK